MKVFPYDAFELIVNEPLVQAKARLAQNLGPPNFWGVFSSAQERPFNGEIKDEKFEIYRNIHYRNSCRPILHGTFQPHPSGTVIEVRMRMPIYIMAFLLFLITMAISFAMPFTGLWTSIRQAGVMVGAIVLMTYGGFWYEAGRSKKAFLEIFSVPQTPGFR